MSLDAAHGLLACPVCESALAVDDKVARCPGSHSFDVARQGYLNLLGGPAPANADSPAMVAARARFLDAGLFDPLADEVARRLGRSRVIAEVGAGTGFYLARTLGVRDARGVALDVSVAAARAAAKAHPRAASVVADVWRRLPLLPGRLDAVLVVFAPRNMAEFARVLGAGGLLVVVTPTASHLRELRERHRLLGIDDDKDTRLARSASRLFEPVAAHRLEFTASADAHQVHDLIAMGPNAFHGVPDDLSPTDLTISVTVSLFRKLSA